MRVYLCLVCCVLGLANAEVTVVPTAIGGVSHGLPINSNPAPRVSSYTNNANANYTGSSATNNNGTIYLQNGKYQGQSPANSSVYLNNQNKINLINQMPD